MGIPKPSIHEIEVGPFVACDEIIEFWKNNGITVQAHTVLTQGKFLNYPPLLEVANKYKVN